MKTRVPVTPLCLALSVLCLFPAAAPAQYLQIVEKIAFCSYRDGNFEIYTMDTDGSGLKRVTQSPENDLWPSWSPDGKQIAFEESDRIYVINADGTGRRPLTLTAPGRLDRRPSWSPDGSKILFVSTLSGNADLYTMNPDGTDQRPLTSNPGVDTSPSWSPDSTKIAFLSERDGSYGIYVIRLM